MPDNKQVKIHFLCEVHNTDSPPEPLTSEIARYLVEPAIPTDLGYSLSRGDFQSEPGTLDHYTIDMMDEADLVIADLSALSGTSYFLLGARAYKNRPIVYIRDEAYPQRYDFSTDIPVTVYTPDDYEDSILSLREEIERALRDKSPGTGSDHDISRPPREMRHELADRIEATAEVIRSLRINSTGESVERLIAIANELKDAPDENHSSHLQRAAEKALAVIYSLLDELSSQPGARMAITGAISLIVGGTGTSGATAFGAGLAFWYGKDVFTKWINTWGRRRAPNPQKKKSG
jgi:hypothetical protein